MSERLVNAIVVSLLVLLTALVLTTMFGITTVDPESARALQPDQVADTVEHLLVPSSRAPDSAPLFYTPEIIVESSYSINEGKTLSFTVLVRDEDSQNVRLIVDNLPGNAKFENNNFEWVPTYNQDGMYTLTFSAVDDDGMATMKDVNVQVIDVNRDPIFTTSLNQEVVENEELVFEINANDLDGDLVTIQVKNLPTGAEFDGKTFTWTPNGAYQEGEHSLIAIATDSRGGSIVQTLKILVTNKVFEQPGPGFSFGGGSGGGGGY